LVAGLELNINDSNENKRTKTKMGIGGYNLAKNYNYETGTQNKVGDDGRGRRADDSGVNDAAGIQKKSAGSGSEEKGGSKPAFSKSKPTIESKLVDAVKKNVSACLQEI
jgi:hypothetical protein